jgi:UDP-glucose 4-epimerase
MRILVTGGAGYIGSHTVKKLLEQKNDILVYDSYVNSSPIALERVRELTGRNFEVVEADIRDWVAMRDAIERFRPEGVVHLAGLKAVGESAEKPLEYYAQNVTGTVVLLQEMERAGCRRIVFSSSATVYGEAEYLPYDENHPLKPVNPYGRTKFFIEEIIRDWVASQSDARAVLLRYFNPVGADASGRIGEDPGAIPNNLLPYIAQVAVGRIDRLRVFGDGYNTRDGTGERDYIHVEDLASAHLSAIDYVAAHTGCEAFNVGTGQSVTVLEMIHSFEKASGVAIPFSIVENRPGDIARAVAGIEKCHALLGWCATHSLEDICRSTWHWQTLNPRGYEPE